MGTPDFTDLLMAALFAVMGYIGKVALDTRRAVDKLAQKLDDHVREHKVWNGVDRRQRDS